MSAPRGRGRGRDRDGCSSTYRTGRETIELGIDGGHRGSNEEGSAVLHFDWVETVD